MKFGKRLLRIVAIMPSQYREKLFLDYDMLKGNIKDFVNATLAFRNDEPATAAVCASLEDGHNDTSHPLELMLGDELMLRDGVNGRVEKKGGGLDVDIVEPKQWHSGIEGVEPEVEAFIHHVFHSEGDNAADDAHILSYQKLELMKVEEEARQTSLHASRSCWDMRKLQALQRRIAQLYVDFTILDYCNSVNYEDLRWNYIHHVEAQDFYVLQPQFQDYTKQCERLMGVGELEQPSMSAEELDLEQGHLTLISRLLELSVTTEHASSTHNAQSFRPPASAQLMCLQGSMVN
ncbi:unnamed protein product [Sphagnum jensenii]|uniref:Uncharacterized protein n=1 Tax=Sphagnum jensenii TaxID=128206 RepID=A0ABP1BEC7_9BRYO